MGCIPSNEQRSRRPRAASSRFDSGASPFAGRREEGAEAGRFARPVRKRHCARLVHRVHEEREDASANGKRGAAGAAGPQVWAMVDRTRWRVGNAFKVQAK